MVTLFLDTLGIGLIIPVFPSLVATFMGHDAARTSHLYGTFIATYAAMQVLFAPVVGGLSDRFGRRPVLLASLFGAAVNYALLATVASLPLLFVGRVIAGITGASFSTANAYIADVTPPKDRARVFGMMGAVFGLGFIVGPALGGIVGSFGVRVPFLLAAGLNLLNFTYGMLVLPESLAPADRRPFSLARSNSIGALKALQRHPVTLGLAATLTCASMAQQILQSMWALYGMGRFHWTQIDVGASLAAVGLGTAVVQGGLIRYLLPRLGERRAMVFGLSLSALSFAGIGFASRGWMLLALVAPLSLGSIAGPAGQSIVSRHFGPSEQGEIQGALSSIQSFTNIIAPLLATHLYAVFGSPGSVPFVPGAPFLAGAAFQSLGLVLAARLFARLPAALDERDRGAASVAADG